VNLLSIPDSTRLKPLLLLTVSGPLLTLLLLAQLQSRSLREQSERAAVRRLRAIALSVEANLAVHSEQSLSDPETARRLTALARSLFVRLQLIELSEPPRLLYDSQTRSTEIDWEGRGGSGSIELGDIDSGLRELFLARTAGSGEDRRPGRDSWQSLAAVRLSRSDDRLVIIRASSETFPASAERTLATALLWLTGIALTLVLATGVILIHRKSQMTLRQLATMHRSIRRLTEHDDSLPAVEPRLSVLADAYALAARRIDQLVSGHRSRISELETATGFLETVLEAMVEGVLVVDRQQRVAFANQAAVRLLGAAAAPAGRPVLEVVRHPIVDQTLRMIESGEDGVQSEFELRGEQRILSLYATRLRGNASGGAMLVLHDVTDLRRLENLRKEFVSNVSHELKTPLAGIQAYAETLLGGAIDDSAACHRFVTRIQEQGNRLNDLVQDLLQLGRIEAGQEAFQLERVSVAESILASVESQQPIAEVKQISIELQSPSADLFVRADRKGLQTIFDNLISNAVKYTPESGRIEIRWSRWRDRVQIDVADSGVGIASEHLPRIFERFYRVDEARSRDIGGTGLGLSIVKHLTSEFGGSIDVRSEPGHGSTFTLRLPAA
jgi:two-component system phosphate regulon sensor histidine kinase PhoR